MLLCFGEGNEELLPVLGVRFHVSARIRERIIS